MKSKRFVSFLAITMLISFSLQSIFVNAAVSTNIISNPGFESGMTGWLPKHVGNATAARILGTVGGNASVVNGIGRNGSKALKIVQGNQVEGGSLTAWARAEYQFIPNEIPKVGSAYLFSAWIKAESIPAGVNPSVQLILALGADQGDELLHYQDEAIYSGPLTTQWQKFTGVTRLMSFEQQDSPNTQYKGMIGFHSSPKYAGANPGFDQGIKQSAPLKEFHAYAFLAPGPIQAIPLIMDDMEVLKPIYNFIFDKTNSDSKLLVKDSGSEVFVWQDTDIAVYRSVLEDTYFVYKLDFNSATADAILTMSLADDYKIEIANSENGPWTTAATGKKLMASGGYKADEIIDLASYLKKNSENSVFVKFSDNTKGTKGTAKNGLMLRALEIFSKTGAMEFKLANTPTPTPTKGTTSSKTSSAAGSSAINSSTGSVVESSSDSSTSSESTIESQDSQISKDSSSVVSNDGIVIDSSVIKPSFADITIDYGSKIVRLTNKLTVKDLKDSFKLGEGYTFTIVDGNDKEITNVDTNVNDSMKIAIAKNGEKYTMLSIDAPNESNNSILLIIGIIAGILVLAGIIVFILFKKKILFNKK